MSGQNTAFVFTSKSQNIQRLQFILIFTKDQRAWDIYTLFKNCIVIEADESD